MKMNTAWRCIFRTSTRRYQSKGLLSTRYHHLLTPSYQDTRRQPPTTSSNHDWQHIRRHRAVARQGPCTLPCRPIQRIRCKLRFCALGSALPLHPLSTQHWSRHIFACEFEGSNRSRDPRVDQRCRLRVHWRLRERQPPRLARCSARHRQHGMRPTSNRCCNGRP
jgi:hypothetical protein